jgi:hypothetical protein
MSKTFVVSCTELITNDFLHHSKQFIERPNRFWKSGCFSPVVDKRILAGDKKKQAHYYTDAKFLMSDDPSAFAVWRHPELPEGRYTVSVWFPAIDEATDAAVYSVYTRFGIQSAVVNQKDQAEQWITIAASADLSGSCNAVHLKNGKSGFLSVGRIKYVAELHSQSNPAIESYPEKDQFSVARIRPTVCFYYESGDDEKKTLLQLTQVTVLNAGKPMPYHVQAWYGDRMVCSDNLGIVCGVKTVEIGIPDVNTTQEAVFSFFESDTNRLICQSRQIIEPTPKYTVHVMENYHNDLGYEHSVPYKAEYWADWMDDAIRLIEDNTFPQQPQMNYNFWFEHLWQLLMYAKVRTREQMDKVRDLFIQRRLSTAAHHTSYHGQWGDTEQNARIPLYLKQEAERHLGITAGGVLCNFDNPTFSWDSIRSAYDAGFSGVMLTCSGWRGYSDFMGAMRKAGQQNVFYWQLPDGKHKIPALVNHNYPSGMDFHYPYNCDPVYSHADLDRQISGYIHEGTSEYPIDTILTVNYYDNEHPNDNVYQYIRQHNSEFAYPVLLHNPPLEDFFSDVFTRYGDNGEKIIPTYAGEINNFSGDYCTINVNAHAAKNKTAQLMKTAQTLSALASVHDRSFSYPREAIYEQYWKLDEFDEHCYPTGPEYGDFQYYSTLYYKTRGVFDFMLPTASKLVHDGLLALFKQGSNPGQIAVFNPLAHTRDGYVSLWEDQFPATQLIVQDLASGKTINAVRQQDGVLAFYAESVPAIGYRLYAVVAADAVDTVQSDYDALQMIENAFYRIDFCSETGNIIGVCDKETGVQLVKQGKHFNQLIYRVYTPGQSNQYQEFTPQVGSNELIENNHLKTVIRLKTSEPNSGAVITQDVTLHHTMKRIDFTNTLMKVDSMCVPFTADYFSNMDRRYRNNLFYGFPFQIDNHRFQACLSGHVVVDPLNEQQVLWHQIAMKDFITTQNWINVGNDDINVTLFSPDAPTIMYGGISYNDFSPVKANVSSEIYSYFQSARIGPNGLLSPQEANFSVSYSMTSGKGAFDAVRTSHQGLELVNPLLSCVCDHNGLAPSDSYLDISHENVQMTMIKQSEEPGRGYILRFYETAGKACEKVQVHFKLFDIDQAFLTDVAENNDCEINADENWLQFSIDAFSMVTIRVLGRPETSTISDIQAAALSDAEILLTWQGNAARYNIFRSTRPDLTPNAYDMIGSTAGLQYLDTGTAPFTRFDACGFAPGETFYYRIQPVSDHHVAGDSSIVVHAALMNENVSPPNPVRGLMAMQLKKLAGNNRVAVQWEKPADRDIAAYNIYRSTTQGCPPLPENKVTPFVVLQQFHGTYMEVYTDQFMLEPGQTYYYRVCPIDSAGNEQTQSPEAMVSLLEVD